MKPRQLTTLMILLLVTPNFVFSSLTITAASTQSQPDLYFGVDVAYESISATEELIDKVSNYTNVFIIGCYGNYNETRLTILSQYTYDKGLAFIVYTDDPRYPSTRWILDAKTQWGDNFFGIYVYDEPGGKQLDYSKYPAVHSANDYDDAAEKYINAMSWYTNLFKMNFSYPTRYQLFTSDYALYWYDYKAGYDTVFAEFGWNYSRQINVALSRGAATVQNKDWGVMIAWTYTAPPYIESGPELYSDMVLAYESGAKYIMVFDSNEDWTQGILEQEHLAAMEQFWQYAKDHPRTNNPVSSRTAYVLPKNYAYGFRGPEDKIWGLWEADALSTDISMSVASLLQIFGNNIDIIYPDEQQTAESTGYGSIVNWNDPRLLPPQRPDAPDFPTQPPTPTPAISPTPNLTPNTTPTPSPIPQASPTEQPTLSPDVAQVNSLPTVLGFGAGFFIAIGVATAIILKLKKKR